MFDPQAARERCEAATPEPWVAELDYVSALIPGKRPNGEIIGRLQPSISDLFSREQEYANAEFAAHARSDLPAALEVLEAIRRVAEDAGCNLPHPLGTPCGDCGNCRILAILGESE
ncbi:hypothetical protein LCGC14_3153620 [marine sediment metagenome]|uniref:Uncharacterized protein n=1 Tax=marine sediment metagenome TaxID=412755 RepID=A0A0F8VTD4_9ZZZZ